MSTSVIHRTREMLALERFRAEWILWLALTTDLNPFENIRTLAARRADAAMCNAINGAGPLADANPCPKALLQ